jgi:hypothetical protein
MRAHDIKNTFSTTVLRRTLAEPGWLRRPAPLACGARLGPLKRASTSACQRATALVKQGSSAREMTTTRAQQAGADPHKGRHTSAPGATCHKQCTTQWSQTTYNSSGIFCAKTAVESIVKVPRLHTLSAVAAAIASHSTTVRRAVRRVSACLRPPSHSPTARQMKQRLALLPS